MVRPTNGTFDLPYLNEQLERETPPTIVKWAWDALGPAIAATSSFQTQSLPLLHIIGKTVPEMPIFFLDTGFHFPETLAYRDELASRLGLNVKTLSPMLDRDEFRVRHGDLFRANPDMCCYINKVEPLRTAQRGLDGWITGIRRDQTTERRDTQILTRDSGGKYKVCPMATWTSKDIWRYINRHDLPVHPLLSQGYLSIGCAPCTRAVVDGEDARSGRWANSHKTECGLHIDLHHDANVDVSKGAES